MRERGQYMVEFAFAFLFVIASLFGALQLILLGYNYNIAERTAWEAARAVSLGRRDAEIGMMPNDTGVYGIIQREFLDRVFTGGLMTVDFGRNLDTNPLVSPETEIERAEGLDVIVDLSYKTTFWIPVIGPIIEVNFPVKARLPIVAFNDIDRDGCVDRLETQRGGNRILTPNRCRGFAYTCASNHRNLDADGDGICEAGEEDDAITFGDTSFLISLDDDDGDGVLNRYDTGLAYICGNPLAGGSVTYLHAAPTVVAHTLSGTHTNLGGGLHSDAAPVANGPFAEGRFASHLWWFSSTGNTVEDDWHWLPRELPWGQMAFYGAPADCVTILFDLHYDFDNDGWEDKFDADTDAYSVH